MKKHYTPLDPDTKIDEVPSLPDRSDLSKLYPEAKPQTFSTEARINIIDATHLPKTVGTFAIKIGLLVPLPFLVGMVPAIIFIMHVTFDNIFQFLPLMTLTMLVWGAAVVLMVNKVSRLLDRLSVSPAMFLCLHISCLLLIAPPMYSVATLISNVWLALVVFSLVTASLSIFFCWLFLQLILNDTLLGKTKITFIGIIVFLCLCSAVSYIIFNQA